MEVPDNDKPSTLQCRGIITVEKCFKVKSPSVTIFHIIVSCGLHIKTIYDCYWSPNIKSQRVCHCRHFCRGSIEVPDSNKPSSLPCYRNNYSCKLCLGEFPRIHTLHNVDSWGPYFKHFTTVIILLRCKLHSLSL